MPQNDGLNLVTLAATAFGVQELLLLGGALGMVVLVLGWALLSRRRELPGHARDGAAKLTRELIDELEARAERLERLIERAESTLSELRASEQRAAAKPPAVITEAKLRHAAPIEQSMVTDPVHREVCAMADDGLGPVDIARRLQMPTGQVELILNLRGRRVAVRN